jgi:L-asparaginase
VHVLRRPVHRRPSPIEQETFPPVPIIKIGLDNDDRLLRSLADLGYKGVVAEGFDAGHVPVQVVSAIDALARIMPVVLSSRVPGGPIFHQTYAFAGSEIDLLNRG